MAACPISVIFGSDSATGLAWKLILSPLVIVASLAAHALQTRYLSRPP
jgi:hypothetical protein